MLKSFSTWVFSKLYEQSQKVEVPSVLYQKAAGLISQVYAVSVYVVIMLSSHQQ